ncbi:hypothetical protein [Paraburkholderia tropica]|uniref:hypothetical protein n=1 Tax=Paraburkholderia tropica TaxID=92647 RepID=UPI0038BD38A4
MAHRVQLQMYVEIPSGDRCVVLAGNRYREFLMDYLNERFTTEVSTHGFRIGEQQHWLLDNRAGPRLPLGPCRPAEGPGTSLRWARLLSKQRQCARPTDRSRWAISCSRHGHPELCACCISRGHVVMAGVHRDRPRARTG